MRWGETQREGTGREETLTRVVVASTEKKPAELPRTQRGTRREDRRRRGLGFGLGHGGSRRAHGQGSLPLDIPSHLAPPAGARAWLGMQIWGSSVRTLSCEGREGQEPLRTLREARTTPAVPGTDRAGLCAGHSGLAQSPARQRLGRHLHTHTGLNVEKSTPPPGTALRGSPQKRGEVRTEQRAVDQAAGSPSSHLGREREKADSPASGTGATGFSFGKHRPRSIPPTR